MRYWLFALNTDSLYEAMRASVDASLGLSGATCIQPAASAIRDSKGRIMLAIGPDTPGYELLLIQLQVIQLQGKVTEITRADYIAGLEPAPSTGGGGGVSSWNDLTDRPFATVGSGLTVVGTALTVPTYSRRFAWASPYSYLGRAASGSATSAAVWTIKRTQLSAAGAIVATLTATNVAWDNYASASYS